MKNKYTNEEREYSRLNGTCLRCKEEVYPMLDIAKEICLAGFMCDKCKIIIIKEEAREETLKDVEKMIESIDTQYPDDDGEPFEVLACNYVKELKKKLKKLRR